MLRAHLKYIWSCDSLTAIDVGSSAIDVDSSAIDVGTGLQDICICISLLSFAPGGDFL
jgi:hypothetical protein